MSKIKILMADDEPDVLFIMSKKIAKEGYEVITAKDGQEAVEKAEKEDPDIILLDINMPKLNGFEVLTKIRENPREDKWQPVIMISARNELKDIQDSYEMEADHYITKPCTYQDVLKSIKKMVSLMPQHKSGLDLEQAD